MINFLTIDFFLEVLPMAKLRRECVDSCRVLTRAKEKIKPLSYVWGNVTFLWYEWNAELASYCFEKIKWSNLSIYRTISLCVPLPFLIGNQTALVFSTSPANLVPCAHTQNPLNLCILGNQRFWNVHFFIGSYKYVLKIPIAWISLGDNKWNHKGKCYGKKYWSKLKFRSH